MKTARGLIVNVTDPLRWCKEMWDYYGFDYDLQSVAEHSVFIWSYCESNGKLLKRLTGDGIRARTETWRI